MAMFWLEFVLCRFSHVDRLNHSKDVKTLANAAI
jgi:hypothetical protein